MYLLFDQLLNVKTLSFILPQYPDEVHPQVQWSRDRAKAKPQMWGKPGNIDLYLRGWANLEALICTFQVGQTWKYSTVQLWNNISISNINISNMNISNISISTSKNQQQLNNIDMKGSTGEIIQ